jgi:hypothetical protein
VEKMKRVVGRFGELFFGVIGKTEINNEDAGAYSDARVSDSVYYPKSNMYRNINTRKYLSENMVSDLSEQDNANLKTYDVHKTRLLVMDTTRMDILGDILHVSKDLLLNFHTEIKSQVEHIDKLRNKNGVDTSMQTCLCGFHLGIPENVVYVISRDDDKKSHLVDMYIKPRIMDRNTKQQISKSDYIKLDWNDTFYEYHKLNRYIKNSNTKTLELIEKLRQSGVPSENKNEHNDRKMYNIYGTHIIESIYMFDEIVNSNSDIKNYMDMLYNLPSPKSESTINEKKSDILFDSKTVSHNFVLEYFGNGNLDDTSLDYYTKFYKDSSDNFTLYCVDYCTLTWAIMSESSYFRYQKNSINSVYDTYVGTETQHGICNLKNIKTCSSMWGYSSNRK